jgi:hypothetical protein
MPLPAWDLTATVTWAYAGPPPTADVTAPDSPIAALQHLGAVHHPRARVLSFGVAGPLHPRRSGVGRSGRGAGEAGRLIYAEFEGVQGGARGGSVHGS